jgi:hypothetical protein
MGDFRAINLELELFNPELREKVQVHGRKSSRLCRFKYRVSCGEG